MLGSLLGDLLKEQGEYRIYILLWSDWHPWAIFKKSDFCFCKNIPPTRLMPACSCLPPRRSCLYHGAAVMISFDFFPVSRKLVNGFWTVQQKKSTSKPDSRSINSNNWQSDPTELLFWYCPQYSPEICRFKLPLAKDQICQWLRYFVKNSHCKCCHQLQMYLWPRSSKSHVPQMELEFKYSSFQALLFNLIRCLLTQSSCCCGFQAQVSEPVSAQHTHLPAWGSQTLLVDQWGKVGHSQARIWQWS